MLNPPEIVKVSGGLFFGFLCRTDGESSLGSSLLGGYIFKEPCFETIK